VKETALATTSRATLVTGCSSGIGSAIAERLHHRGYPVYATARDATRLERLASLGITTLALDVTDEDSMRSAVDRVADQHGAVGVLINNAGYGVAGVIEDVPVSMIHDQFATNVFGPTRLTQLVLPAMRAQAWGRIINMSSILGRAAPPGGGVYDASKHAIEAITDALRLEVAGFGIRAVLIEPGPVRTGFAATTVAMMPPASPSYAAFRDDLSAWYAATFGMARPNLLARFAIRPQRVAAVIERAVQARRPKARYPVGLIAHSFLALRRVLPDFAFDRFVRLQFPTPRQGCNAYRYARTLTATPGPWETHANLGPEQTQRRALADDQVLPP
jgi:NAD(P)-dependent dehydrogenase (short-subunit alcohol dehydrogenase family)